MTTKDSTPVEVVLNFDTTGSMSPCIAEVRRKVESLFTNLLKELPNLKIGLGANGDYCDRNSSYVTSWQDLTNNIHELTQFVRNIRNTGGGDLPECYELVLHQARKLSWSHNALKVFVLIADDVPHPADDRQNREYNGGQGLSWENEADQLAKMGVLVHAVQCLSKGRHADNFYRELARRTGGYHLVLDQFTEVNDLITGICYRQAAPERLQEFENEVTRTGRMTRTLDRNLANLSGRPVGERFRRAPLSLHAVPPGRFQMLRVDTKTSIRDFVEVNGLLFQKGRGFYEFTKPELVQEGKEVVLRDKDTGDMFSGDKARAMIGLAPGERAKVKPAYLSEYDVFIQSTSYNRSLVLGTRFLYEVDLSR